MISILLLKKILSLFVMILCGFVLVKIGLLKYEDSKTLSTISIYLITPCVIFSSFSIECTPEVRTGVLLAFLAAALVHVLMIFMDWLLDKAIGLEPVEKASIVYSNAGNLIIPLVTALLGREYVIYSISFVAVQLLLMWSHGKAIICKDEGFDIIRILKNVNMISVILGILIFITGFRFPMPVMDAMESIADMIGPAAMLVIGMLIGNTNLKQMFSYHRAWLIIAMRLCIVPLGCLGLLWLSGLTGMSSLGGNILMCTMLAVSAPSACNVTQMALIYGENADYANTINIFSTLLCVVTMPLMIGLYCIVFGI